MKKTSFFLLFLFFSVSLSSCLKKTIENLDPSGTATIVVDTKKVTIKEPTSVSALGLVTIVAGTSENGFTIVLNKSDIKAGKSYDLKNAVGFFTFLYEGRPYLPSTGSLEITNFKDNKIVEGKFSFEGSPVNVSAKSAISGTFEVKIIL